MFITRRKFEAAIADARTARIDDLMDSWGRGYDACDRIYREHGNPYWSEDDGTANVLEEYNYFLWQRHCNDALLMVGDLPPF